MHVGVYPYSMEVDPILRHSHLLSSSYDICALVSPRGWGLSGHKVLFKHNKKELTVNTEFETFVEDIDTIFIPEFNVSEAVETKIIEKISSVVSRVKKVICSAKLSEKNKINLIRHCEQMDCVWEDLNKSNSIEHYGLSRYIEENPPLEKVDTPILAIAGLWEDTDKFETSLAIRDMFINSEYRISQVGSRNCCEMFGFHSFPSFMWDKNIDAADKVCFLNRWIKQLIDKEKSDLLILTVPGCIQNLNEVFTRGFGLVPHIVFQAILVDYLIFCTMYDYNSIEFLQEISKMCKYRFGVEVDCFHMSNLFFDLASSQEQSKVVVNHVCRSTVTKTLEMNFGSVQIFNMLDTSSQKRVFELIKKRLTGDDFPIAI